MRDFMYVADTREDWVAYVTTKAIARVAETPEGKEVLGYEPGFHADHIGPVMTDPGEYDNSVFPPIEITPPTFDERYHVNLRVIGEEVEEGFIRSKRYKPQDTSVEGVEWIEPELVTSPVRVWLGGMVYFSENIPDDVLLNTSPPVLNMTTAHLGDLVKVQTPGTWLGTPDLITYQWFRDDVPINQAITPNHTVNVVDVGHTLVCKEIARNSAGDVFALSNACVVS